MRTSNAPRFLCTFTSELFPLQIQSKFQTTLHFQHFSELHHLNRCVVWPRRGTVNGCILEHLANHGCNHFSYCGRPQEELKGYLSFFSAALLRHAADKLVVPVWLRLPLKIGFLFRNCGYHATKLQKCFVQAHLSSVPKFLREKLRGFVDTAEFPLADWIPTIPPTSVSVSMAKSLRIVSMLLLSFSQTGNTSDNKTQGHLEHNNKTA